jgi:hypothetical protein
VPLKNILIDNIDGSVSGFKEKNQNLLFIGKEVEK